MQGAELHQYKNAFHFGRINSNIAISKDQSHRQAKLSLQQHLPTKHPSHLPDQKDRQQLAKNSHETLQGIGMTIDDVGHMLLAEWKSNKIEGMYFLFKSNIVEELDSTMACFGICQYGHIRSGLLEGDNYMYNISGSLMKGTFLRNKLVEQCYIVHNNKGFVCNSSNDEAIKAVQCEVVNLNPIQSRTPNNKEDVRKKQVPQFESFSPLNKEGAKNKQINYEMVDVSLFTRPLQFLSKMRRNNSIGEQQQSRQRNQLCKLQLNEHQVFLGFMQQSLDNAANTKSTNTVLRLNGFGVIFRDGWPFKYGRFQKGKLQGLGRIYETQMNISDGFFQDNKMTEGFVIDYHNNQLSFGYNSHTPQSSELEQQFIVTHNYKCSELQVISEFKKQHHLKSLKFKNNYFTSPRLFFRSPWPVSLITKLYERSEMENIIKNFNPTMREFDLSEIEKEGQSSENRVERLIVNELQDKKVKQTQSRAKKLNLCKSRIIDAEINNYMKSKDNTVTLTDSPQPINNYLKEYEHIVRSQKQKVPNHQINKPEDGSLQSQRNSNRPYLETDRHRPHPKTDRHRPHPETDRDRPHVETDRHQPNLETDRHRSYLEANGHRPYLERDGRSASPKKEFSYASPHQASKQQPQRISVIQKRTTVPNQKDLTELIKQYQICETDRRNALSYYTPSRNYTDRKSTPRNIQGQRYMIHQEQANQRLNITERRPTRSRSTKRTQLDLHRIYDKYLKS